MIQWSDDAIVLSARRHGEAAAVVAVLAEERGRQAGLVPGGAGRRLAGVIQPGNRVRATWRARVAENLGMLSLELLSPDAALALDDPDRLAVLAAACAMADQALPEREPHPGTYAGLAALLDHLDRPDIRPILYVHWELGLLADLGYGLALTACAATGSRDDLAYVSPRSGRAVSRMAGEPWRDRLLPLPAFLVQGGAAGGEELRQGLALTGFFLERYVFAPLGKPLPAARLRLVERLTA